MKIVALLESMYGWRGYNSEGEEAPRFFRINPNNHSGKRLYRLCGSNNTLIVTNCCRYVQRTANHHGKPDLDWVKANLTKAIEDGADLILICGNVAKATFLSIDLSNIIRKHQTKIFLMDHPASRRWSNEKLDKATATIASYATKA